MPDIRLRFTSTSASCGGALARDGGGRPVYREEHPDRSVFFLPRVEAGRWEIRYRMRAVFPGDYRALPATVEAMYVPALDANTEARRLRISPAAQPQG